MHLITVFLEFHFGELLLVVGPGCPLLSYRYKSPSSFLVIGNLLYPEPHPVQLHRIPHSEAWDLMLFGWCLNMLNNFTFEFVFGKRCLMENAACSESLEHGLNHGLALGHHCFSWEILGTQLPSLHTVTTLHPQWGRSGFSSCPWAKS